MTGPRSFQRFCMCRISQCKASVTYRGVNWFASSRVLRHMNNANTNGAFFGDREYFTSNSISEKMVELTSLGTLDALRSDSKETAELRDWAVKLIERLENDTFNRYAKPIIGARDLAFIRGLHSVLFR